MVHQPIKLTGYEKNRELESREDKLERKDWLMNFCNSIESIKTSCTVCIYTRTNTGKQNY